jgi:hypothetical protein
LRVVAGEEALMASRGSVWLAGACVLGLGCVQPPGNQDPPGYHRPDVSVTDAVVDAPPPPEDVPAACDPAACDEACRAGGYAGGTCAEWDRCACAPLDGGGPDADGEECGDGIDNNGNGAIDEDCSCAAGTVQRCYAGPPETRRVGSCDDGLQDCDGAGEFAEWGECRGSILPQEEVCGDGVDDDCDGAADDGCPGPCVPGEWSVETYCSNGEDDDCDGATDCDDTDCVSAVECQCCRPGSTRWCDTPMYCSWGLQECRPDGRWGYCSETTLRPGPCAGGSAYDPACCVSAGECCQNFYFDPLLPSDASVGDCTGASVLCT